jgi:hypothetical protein
MSNNQHVYLYRDFLNENANVSARDRNEMCGLAYSFRQEKGLIFLLFIMALLSLLITILLYFIYKNKEVRRIYFLTELDLKFILMVGFVSYTISGINSLIFFVYQFAILLMDLSPCSYITSGFFCVHIQKLFVTVCPLISLLVFFAMFLERCYISLGLRSNGIFGFLLAFFIVAIPISIHVGMSEPKTYKDDRIFCGSILTRYEGVITYRAYISVIFEYVISLLDFCLLLYNKRRISAYRWGSKSVKIKVVFRRHQEFNLNTSFNLKSIELSIKFISAATRLIFLFKTRSRKKFFLKTRSRQD